MTTHLRNLLLLAALCWVAPASAGQHLTPAELEQWHEDGCPSEREAQPIVIAGDVSLDEVPVSAARSAFLP